MSLTALVTGGAEFIGSNFVKRLLNDCWSVILFDDLSRKGSDINLSWLKDGYRGNKFEIVFKDIRDYKALKEQVAKSDEVFHLAGQAAVTTSVSDPRHDFEVNAMGAFNVLEAARELGHKPIIIYSSTNKVYENMENIEVNEQKNRYEFSNFPKGISEDKR